MDKKCYQIKNCPFNGTDPEDSKCPVYKKQIDCWEYDWISFYNQMTDCNEKIVWRDNMLKRCKNCKIFPLHRKKIKKILDKLKNS